MSNGLGKRRKTLLMIEYDDSKDEEDRPTKKVVTKTRTSTRKNPWKPKVENLNV